MKKQLFLVVKVYTGQRFPITKLGLHFIRYFEN